MSPTAVKVCPKCEQRLPLSEFPRGTARTDRRGTYCRPCKRIIDNNHYATSEKRRKAVRKFAKDNTLIKRKWLREYLVGRSCQDCGESDPIVLEFDHLDPTQKTANVAKLIGSGGSVSQVQREIDKCDLVCANCHRRRTAKMFNWHKASVV